MSSRGKLLVQLARQKREQAISSEETNNNSYTKNANCSSESIADVYRL